MLHVLGALDQALDHGAQAFAVLGALKACGRVGQARRVVGRRAGGGVDGVQNLFDLAEHARVDGVDAIGRPAGRDIGGVNLFEIGLAERAFLLERLIDQLVERRIIAGGVVVPDFEIARGGGLGERLDLAQCDVGECERPFVLVAGHSHEVSPIALEGRKG